MAAAPIGEAEARARGLLAASADRIDELEYVVDTDAGDYVVSGIKQLTTMLDSPLSTLEVVVRHRETLEWVSGRRTVREIIKWVDTVRLVLLADEAYDMNRAADWMGANGGYVVVAERTVTNRTGAEGLALTSLPEIAVAAVAQTGRPRSLGRRRAAARRASSGSPGRLADDDPHEPCSRRGGARAAA